ncbi:MAG TPA: Ldh family oxidoreductase [Burkholderiales bacterium]|nr:Ldh family oxidoreductase [Burkholderiales bacterium]
MEKLVHIPADTVRKQIVGILTGWGLDPEAIQTTATVMIETDLSGVDSHGVSMLMDYDNSRIKGKLNVKASPRIVRQNAVTALIDADAGLGHPAAALGMRTAIEKAKALGVAVVTVRNSHHFGAAGYYANLAAQAGLIGMVTSATRSINTVPTRGRDAVLGTNPIAFAAPAKRNRPFLLDMATATVAANKVRVYELNGKPVPAGWVLDGAGVPITEPTHAVDTLFKRKPNLGGGLAPVGGTEDTGGYKGYGLGMLAHILGGPLSGSSFSPIRVKTQKPGDPDNLGHFFLAIDPRQFREEGEFEEDLDMAIDFLHAVTPIDPQKPVLVPGDPEAMKRADRLKNGIPMPLTLVQKLEEVAQRAETAFLFAQYR